MSGFGGGGVDDGLDDADGVGGEATLGSVAADYLFVGGDVDAVELVLGDIGVEPLDVGADMANDGAGLLGGCCELSWGEISEVGHVALDDELWQLKLLFLKWAIDCFAAWLFEACLRIDFAPGERCLEEVKRLSELRYYRRGGWNGNWVGRLDLE